MNSINTPTHVTYKNVCFKNICFGIAAIVAALGYSVARLDDCYRSHVDQLRSGFWFAVNVERYIEAEKKAAYDKEHPEEVEAKKAEAEAKAKKAADEQEDRLVKKVLDERNRRLQKIAEKSSAEVK